MAVDFAVPDSSSAVSLSSSTCNPHLPRSLLEPGEPHILSTDHDQRIWVGGIVDGRGRLRRHAERIEAKRWGWVASRIGAAERRLATTPAWLIVERERIGVHVFLTDIRLLIAITMEPIGSERHPFILDVPLLSIDRLILTDDGVLITKNRDRRGQSVSNTLVLFPSPFSATLIRELAAGWSLIHGRRPEGDWTSWQGHQLGSEIERLQERYASLNATEAPLLDEALEKQAIGARLASLGAEVDWELCEQRKQERGIPNTPFNTQPDATSVSSSFDDSTGGGKTTRERVLSDGFPGDDSLFLIRRLGSRHSGSIDLYASKLVVSNGRSFGFIYDPALRVGLAEAVALLHRSGNPETEEAARTLGTDPQGRTIRVFDRVGGRAVVADGEVRAYVPIDRLTLVEARSALDEARRRWRRQQQRLHYLQRLGYDDDGQPVLLHASPPFYVGDRAHLVLLPSDLALSDITTDLATSLLARRVL